MTISLACPAFVDPPGPYAPVEEWISFRDDLLASGLPGIEPFLIEAEEAIARGQKWPT